MELQILMAARKARARVLECKGAVPSDRCVAPSHPSTLAPSHLRTLAPSHLVLLLPLLLASCTKEIEVELPITPSKVVVEGTIETGSVPIVLLSRTQSYFEPTGIAGLASLYITDATVIVSDGFTTDTLDKICSDQLTEEQLIAASEATGISIDLLRQITICAWTDLQNEMLGVEGRTYNLRVLADGDRKSVV